MLAGTDWIRC